MIVIGLIHFCVFTVVYQFSEGKDSPAIYTLTLSCISLLITSLLLSMLLPFMIELIPLVFDLPILYMASNPNSSQHGIILDNLLTRYHCSHASWFLMTTDSASVGSICDYKIVRGPNNLVEVELAKTSETHNLGRAGTTGDPYYVCQSCHATRCANCHAAAGN